MPPQFQILDNILERLNEFHSLTDGCLYGVIYEGKVLIIGMGNETRARAVKGTVWYGSAQQCYPTGLDWCGVFYTDDRKSKSEFTALKLKLKDVAVTNNPLLLRKDLNTGEVDVYYLDGIFLRLCEYQEVKEAEFKENFVYLNLIGMTRVILPLNTERRDVVKEIGKISDRVANNMAFKLDDVGIYLHKYSGKDDQPSLGRLWDSMKKEKDFRFNMEVIKVYALFAQGRYFTDVKKIVKPHIYDHTYPAQILDIKPGEKDFKLLMNLPFDNLCIAHRERTIDEVYNLLLDSAERTVSICENYLLKYIDDPLRVHNIRAHHFFPDKLSHPISLIFSTENDDEMLETIRVHVHLSLDLPLDRPYFRKTNCLQFIPSTFTVYPFLNIHNGVRPSGIRSDRSKSSITKGCYYYYHYTMDGINDIGWGCAYRSFQTIFSWFKLQGYTTKEVPTHLEIQECLVSLGDKPASFKGSNNWIGSTEVAYVLDSTVDTSCRILNVASGSEMGSVGLAIYEHFEQHGIPIMIGGGVLAHTILGIDIDEESGDMKFLVLDPHYSGEKDISNILKRGFVGWKGIDFWNSKSFYNLCLPQRPNCY